jgi:hypothetical protein
MKNPLLCFLFVFFGVAQSQAISYPIQVNSSFKISGANQFDVKQTESVTALQNRMKSLLQFGELFPTGLNVTAGSTLQLTVSRLAGSDTQYGKVVITSRYSAGQSGAETQTVPLSNGVNNINVTVSGNVYVVYSSSTVDPSREVRFAFSSGFTAMPTFINGHTSTAEWLDMLQNYPTTPDVCFIFRRGVMVMDRVRIDTYKNNDFEALTGVLNQILDEELRHSGIITSADLSNKNRDFANLIYFTTNDPGKGTDNPHATSPGIVRVPIDWVAAPGHVLNNTDAWGISHEIGHHIQQNAWDWGNNTEVQVNIATMASRKLLYPSVTGLDLANWKNALRFLNRDVNSKSYDNDGLDLKAKIPLFWQLQLAFGNDFFQRYYTYVRENAVFSGSSDQEKLNFMKTANLISNKNLIDYFNAWGLTPTPSQTTILNGMGLLKPSILPQTYAESNIVENLSLLQDTLIFQGQTVNYKVLAAAINGVKKVEFYNGATKLGETTVYPFQFTITPEFGVNPITAKIIDANDNVALTSNVVNITVSRAKITSPLDNAVFQSGANITIISEIAVVPGNPIQKVEFFSNDIKVGEVSTAPYQFTLQNQVRGTQKLTVKAYYQNNETSVSLPANVAVGGIFADADTYVRDGSYTNSNFGTDDRFTVKKDGSSYNREAYLRFDLSALTETSYAKALLKLNEIRTNTGVTSSGNKWRLFFVADDTWSEVQLKNSNKPAAGDMMAEVTPINLSGNPQVPQAIEWDITPYLNAELAGDKKISMVLLGGLNNVGTGDADFASREHAELSLRPFLKLYTALDALPVKLVSFKASKADKRAKLTWITISEQNNSHFEVEKSTDGQVYTFLARVLATEAGNTETTYHTYDASPNMQNYYRLIQVDKNGTRNLVAETSLSFQLDNQINLLVYPNPVRSILNIQSQGYTGAAQVLISDLLGRIVLRKSVAFIGGLTQPLDISQFASGNYYLSVVGANYNQSTKFVVN